MKTGNIERRWNELADGLDMIANRDSYAVIGHIEIFSLVRKLFKINDLKISVFSPESAR
jgi:hypothetical protein